MIAPGWFVAFGIAWLVLFVVMLACCISLDADEQAERERDLDHVGEWTSR